MSNQRDSRSDDELDLSTLARKSEVPSVDDFDDLKREVANIKDDVSDIKEDIELLDKANKDSSDRWRSLITNIGLLIISGVITALLSRFIG